MAMGTRRERQEELWIPTCNLARPAGHPFYQRLNQLLAEHDFDRFVEGQCRGFYAAIMGRPGLAPGIYFRLLLVGYFEGIDSERGIAWRAGDSWSIREFVGIPLDEGAPDHTTIARTRRLIDLETHRQVFAWVLELLADAGLVKGKRIGIEATTLEANAALRSIVRRDNAESYEEFLTGLARQSGVATPTREDLARVDRKRKKKGSNREWVNPHDRDARITKMKDGRTHLAHKAEHAVDMDTGAVVAVTLQEAHLGDTTTVKGNAGGGWRHGRRTDRAGGRGSAAGEAASESGRGRGSGGRQGIPQRAVTQTHASRWRAHVYSGEEASRETALGGQGRSAATGVREPATVAETEGQAATPEAWGVDRADIRPLLRHRRHAANTLEKTQQHSQAAADPCGRSEPGIAAEELVRDRNREACKGSR
jgi:transposase